MEDWLVGRSGKKLGCAQLLDGCLRKWGRVKGESLTVERQLWLTLCHLVVAPLSVTAGAEGCW